MSEFCFFKGSVPGNVHSYLPLWEYAKANRPIREAIYANGSTLKPLP